jgi:hypothetical protein
MATATTESATMAAAAITVRRTFMTVFLSRIQIGPMPD